MLQGNTYELFIVSYYCSYVLHRGVGELSGDLNFPYLLDLMSFRPNDRNAFCTAQQTGPYELAVNSCLCFLGGHHTGNSFWKSLHHIS
jgi:hypothetical protein